jgi:putative DNA-invertase from lambdoid prophage Rac
VGQNCTPKHTLDVLARLKDQGVSLHMIDLGGDVTGNGISKLVFTILSAVAEAERDRIAERVATVKADQRQRGRYLGGKIPFGHRVGDHGDLVKVPEKQAAIARIRSLRASGASLRAIATEMKETGHDLSHEAVRAVLARTTDDV